MHNFILFIILIFITNCRYSVTSGSHRALIYGEHFNGFIKITPLDAEENGYLLSFDISLQKGDEKWALHKGSSPYEQSKMLNNCKRAKKTSHIMRNMPFNDTKISSSELMGHTIVVTRPKSVVVACATILFPDQILMKASFHKDPIGGHIYILKLKDNIRLLPDLKYMEKYRKVEPPKEIFEWGFVNSCENSGNSTMEGAREIGIYSRNAITIDQTENATNLEYLILYKAGMPFSCSKIKEIEPRNLKAHDIIFTQSHPFESLHANPTGDNTISLPQVLNIRDDCLDMSSEMVYSKYGDNFYPEANIFGRDSIALKALALQDECEVLRPYQYSMPSLTTVFVHPIIGRINLADDGDAIRGSGELRHAFDALSTRATIMVLKDPLKGASCPQDLDIYCETNENCHTIEDIAVISGRNEPKTTFYGSFPWFNLTDAHAIAIDLLWMKVCANLTYLPYGSIFASSTIKKYSPVSAPIFASIVALEYPINHYTEILINKRRPITHVEAHAHSMDSAVTIGAPCGEHRLGPVFETSWLSDIEPLLKSEENDTSLIIPKNLVTGEGGFLGRSIALNSGRSMACGDFEMRGREMILLAKFVKPFIGYVKLSQYHTENWSLGIPTAIQYELFENYTGEKPNQEKLEWDIVLSDGMMCKTALVYNPLQMDDSSCDVSNPEFCSFGTGSRKAEHLILNSKGYLIVPNLPLAGPFSMANRMLRIRKDNATYACEKLITVNKVSFRWVVYTTRNLSSIQDELAQRFSISDFQIEVDYTRELYQSKCSIYRITVYESNIQIQRILEVFDVENRTFKNDTQIECSTKGPDKSSQNDIINSSDSCNLFLHAQIIIYSFISIFISSVL